MKNLPNILTIFRIISLPVLILMILSSEQKFNFYAFIKDIIYGKYGKNIQKYSKKNH